MNIKGFLGNSVPVSQVASAAKAEKPIQTDSTHDRDANGQEFYQREKKKEKMTNEQFEKALAILREKNFIKDMNWIVMAVYEGDTKYAWVQDQSGQSIRKIVEFELWDLFEDTKKEQTKGQLLRRTA